VAGAHNTIVATRAGKDLVSSLASGLLTVGPRFGGALDGAAAMMTDALDRGLDAAAFVDECKKRNRLIMGIGHKIKSLENPDMRVALIKAFAMEHFPRTPTLEFALAVEAVTTQKRSNLILNVDGCLERRGVPRSDRRVRRASSKHVEACRGGPSARAEVVS